MVIARAAGLCEYCHFPEAASFLPFEIDHIVAQKHRGPTEESNLAWPCYYCNSFKGPNIAGWIPETEEVVRLFHPRKDAWNQHFAWKDALLAPKTKVGRATIGVLEINHPDAVAVREELLGSGLGFAPS